MFKIVFILQKKIQIVANIDVIFKDCNFLAFFALLRVRNQYLKEYRRIFFCHSVFYIQLIDFLII